jgi:hypothetical protein
MELLGKKKWGAPLLTDLKKEYRDEMEEWKIR